ncbi:glycine--tRNA ligase beta subunit [Burkholderiales bacterium GJ-E10]|nr:glycine--tRNA ligase beta subunit [Burkholderiales bacterium GJ-E10]
MKAPLLVEIFTEELPPKALPALRDSFAHTIRDGLVARQLADRGARVDAFATPRRLAVRIADVAAVSPARQFQHKLVPAAIGLDAAGNPTPALRKKLDALGLEYDAARIERVADGKQEILRYQGVAPGIPLGDGLQAALEDAIAGLPIPKVMHYQLDDGRTTVQFVRPAHRLVALHGDAVVPVQALGLQSGRETRGHRFLCAEPLCIQHADTYERQLFEQGKVIASFEARRARMTVQIEAAAARAGAKPVMPAALVDEVTALVEWPVVYESGFEEAFLEVPQSCLILTMQQNQKYFALQDERGALRNRFLLVSNIETSDPSAIVAGNARVVRARLADAKFFFDQDRLQPLESRLSGAENIVYHHRLGSQLQRIERLTALARAIALAIPEALRPEEVAVARAARLAKADLGTLMVGEFPELQGEMGRIYARQEGEREDVAQAIEEHYQPRFAGDAVPASMIGACVALADKLEALAGLFGAGERATGDRDPYALRRNALGVLRILTEKSLPLSLHGLVALAFDIFTASELPKFSRCENEVLDFLYDRLRGMLLEQGYTANETDAVLSLRPERIDRVSARMEAVRAFMQLPQAMSLASANKRIGNILRKAEAAESARTDVLREDLLQEPAERELAAAFHTVAPEVDRLLAAGDDAGVLRALVPLKLPVDRFFDDVMVMVDEPALRANRLTLLARLRTVMNRVADISQLAAG